jgi:serine/threonine protein kinase
MANESNASKRATIKPPAAAPKHLDQLAGKTSIDSADAKGKVVRTVPPTAGATQPGAQESVDTEPVGSTGGPPAGARKAVTILDGDYKLLKKLGKGGMGAVYEAHQISLDRIVAVKVLAKELASKDAYVRRFQREARMMIKLDHANILRCFGVGKDKETGLHYLSMELVEGGSVESWRKKRGRFSIGDALHIILKTAAGLQHAHDKNMIHRDIKPESILLTEDGVVKVADLGLAKDTQENVSLTRTGAAAGTPIYMAPEQARDFKHVDIRVDIYALGVMLYVFLTGMPPFRSDNMVDLVSAKEKGTFDPMRRHNDEVPSKLDLIVDKMIAKDPKNRYASCDELINDLEPLGLANEQLSFMDLEVRPAPADIIPATEIIETDLLEPPAKVSAKTCVGADGKTPAAKTSAPPPPGRNCAPPPPGANLYRQGGDFEGRLVLEPGDAGRQAGHQEANDRPDPHAHQIGPPRPDGSTQQDRKVRFPGGGHLPRIPGYLPIAQNRYQGKRQGGQVPRSVQGNRARRRPAPKMGLAVAPVQKRRQHSLRSPVDRADSRHRRPGDIWRI